MGALGTESGRKEQHVISDDSFTDESQIVRICRTDDQPAIVVTVPSARDSVRHKLVQRIVEAYKEHTDEQNR